MVSFLYDAPAGVVGDITRVDETSVEPAMLIAVASVYAQTYGIPMVYQSGGISQYQTSNVAADFCGVLARTAPEIAASGDAGVFGPSIPNQYQPQNLVTRGYVSVLCQYGTPVRGGIVYVRVAATSGSRLLGGFEATSDGGNNVALTLTQASWATDGMDENNISEIRVAR